MRGAPRRESIKIFSAALHCCAVEPSPLGRAQQAMAGGDKGSHPECHFAASGVAAMINFPLWRAAAIGQSGFDRHRASTGKKNFVRRWGMGRCYCFL